MAANAITPQSGSRRLTRFVKETSRETAPSSSSNWRELRNTGGSGINPNKETAESAELSQSTSLGKRDIIALNTLGQADYGFELSKETGFEEIMESFLQNTFSSDTLTAGSTPITLSIEDVQQDIDYAEYLQGCIPSAFNISIVASQIVTGTVTMNGSKYGDNIAADIADGDVDFDSSGTMTISGSVATGVTTGSFVTVIGSTSNDGHYEITNIAGSVLTLDGTITTETGQSCTLSYTGSMLLDTYSGTVAANTGNQPFKAGDDVTVEVNLGSGWVAASTYGLFFSQVDINGTTETQNLNVVTSDDPYLVSATDRSIELAMTYHLITGRPLNWLINNTDVGIRVTAGDGTNSYQFTFPKCNITAGSTGDASNNESMAGTMTAMSLLDSNDINIQIDRA